MFSLKCLSRVQINIAYTKEDFLLFFLIVHLFSFHYLYVYIMMTIIIDAIRKVLKQERQLLIGAKLINLSANMAKNL